MPFDPNQFFASIISAGAILAGFCGTFLSFRIGRESLYYRQPALSYEAKDAIDIYIGLTQFSSAFLLLTLATLCSMIFGFLIPFLALAGSMWAFTHAKLVVAGLIATLILLIGYFLDEMIHYRILKLAPRKPAHKRRMEWGIAFLAGALALFISVATYTVF